MHPTVARVRRRTFTLSVTLTGGCILTHRRPVV
jgi:hypothetical protein